ncbi:MAG: hypothetical protein K2N03_06915 [Muribaculaceae bacterium]|nr:hypothetical protein [Muribaculaceae bacterium]
MVKHILIFLTILILSFTKVKAQNEGDIYLKEFVAEVNAQCPISLNASLTMSHLEYLQRCLYFFYDINETYSDFNFVDIDKDELKKIVDSLFNNPLSKTLIDELIKYRIDLKLVYKFNDGKNHEVYIPYNDLWEYDSNKITSRQIALDELKKNNNLLPVTIGPETLNYITLKDDNIIYYYTINETIINLNSFSPEELKNIKLYSIENHTDYELFNSAFLYANAGFPIEFIYEGNTSGEKIIFYLSPEEILTACKSAFVKYEIEN